MIKTRIRLVSLTCLACAPVSIAILRLRVGLPWPEVWRLLGWWPLSLADVLRPLLLTAILFAGPLYERAIAERGWMDWIQGSAVKEMLSSWVGWRNFIVVCLRLNYGAHGQAWPGRPQSLIPEFWA